MKALRPKNFVSFRTVHAKFRVVSSLVDRKKRCVIYPMGKPMIPHLLCWRGFAVAYYNFTLAASDLRHPRLLQR